MRKLFGKENERTVNYLQNKSNTANNTTDTVYCCVQTDITITILVKNTFEVITTS